MADASKRKVRRKRTVKGVFTLDGLTPNQMFMCHFLYYLMAIFGVFCILFLLIPHSAN